MVNRKDYSGQIYNHLTPLAFDSYINGKTRWRIRCDCGNEFISRIDSVISGVRKSCGCYNTDIWSKNATQNKSTHKYSGTPEYNAWAHAKGRCYSISNRWYHLYGARGIEMCDAWRSDFSQFLTDMGRRPTKLHSLDRIDNDGNYEPKNCRWATKEEQMSNQTKTIRVTYLNKTQSVRAWCKELQIVNDHTARDRIRRGWDHILAITTPKGA